MNPWRPHLRWFLLALLSLWTVALLLLAAALAMDSYGGMEGVPVLIAAGNVVAAIPFIRPMGTRLVLLARALAVAQGLAMLATGHLLAGAAASIVSMGNSVDPGLSPLTVVTTVAGITLVVLAIFVAPAPMPAARR
jgi:hypothetical protein